jgi:hypothetical protein
MSLPVIAALASSTPHIGCPSRGQVQQARALGDDRGARLGQRRHLRPEPHVGRQVRGVLGY